MAHVEISRQGYRLEWQVTAFLGLIGSWLMASGTYGFGGDTVIWTVVDLAQMAAVWMFTDRVIRDHKDDLRQLMLLQALCFLVHAVPPTAPAASRFDALFIALRVTQLGFFYGLLTAVRLSLDNFLFEEKLGPEQSISSRVEAELVLMCSFCLTSTWLGFGLGFVAFLAISYAYLGTLARETRIK